MMPVPNNYEKNIKTIIDNFEKKRKQALTDLKNHYKEEIKNIKKAAPRKIVLKTLGGTGLGLGVIGGLFLGKYLINKKN